MRFFIPFAQPDESESIYQLIRKFVEETNGIELTQARIRQIQFIRDGKTITETVGDPSGVNKEIVIAILGAYDRYLVCTVNRGVKKGSPMLIGDSQAKTIDYFDRE